MSLSTIEYCIKNSTPHSIFDIFKLISSPTEPIIKLAITYADPDNVKKIMLLRYKMSIELMIYALNKIDELERGNIIICYGYEEDLVKHFIKTTSAVYIEELVDANTSIMYKHIQTIVDVLIVKKPIILIDILNTIQDNLNIQLSTNLLDSISCKINEIHIPSII